MSPFSLSGAKTMDSNRVWHFSLVLGVLLMAALPESKAQDVNAAWPRFRGPNGSGLMPGGKLPTDIEPKSALWSVPLPGLGHSSPVTWVSREHSANASAPQKSEAFTWLSSYDQAQTRIVLSCFRVEDGKSAWEQIVPLQPHPMHRLNNPASSTPAVDEHGVYLAVYEPEHLRLLAWSHSGEKRWERDFGRWVAQHGYGASPIVHRGNLYLLNSQEPWDGLPEPARSQLLAIDVLNGQTKWSCDLLESKACYATPLIWSDARGAEWLVCATQGDGVLVVDPADGRRVWNETVFQQRTVGSPILSGDQLVANNGSGGGGNYVVSVNLAASNHQPAWEVRQGAGYVPSVIEVAGRLYLFADNGVVTCVAADSGREIWRERVSTGFWASPVSDGQTLFCPDKDGILKLIKAGDRFELLASCPLGSPTQASPAISGKRLLVRTQDRLWCFGSE
jgi:outer membrane protein assembly factor BamB